ncbi:MAG: hypothetical protein ACI9KE_000337 [Polyangiales bacterium]|jgi:hypothetical protein
MHGHLSSSPPSWYTDYLLGLERLPRCGRFGEPQSLALQLELDSLPELGSGILQCFVCASQDCEVSEITCETGSSAQRRRSTTTHGRFQFSPLSGGASLTLNSPTRSCGRASASPWIRIHKTSFAKLKAIPTTATNSAAGRVRAPRCPSALRARAQAHFSFRSLPSTVCLRALGWRES